MSSSIIKPSKKKLPQWNYNHHQLSQLNNQSQQQQQQQFQLYLLTNPSELKKQFIQEVPYFWCHHKIGKQRQFEIHLNELNNQLQVKGFPYVDNMLLHISQSCTGNFKIITQIKDLQRIFQHHGSNRKLISIHIFDQTLTTTQKSTINNNIPKNKKIQIKSGEFKQFKRLLYRKNYQKNETDTFMNATRITNWDIAEVNQSRLVLKTLLVAKNNVKGKEDFVKLANCVEQELGKVAEYQSQYKLDSTPQQAIRWYTKQGFYYRLVNNTLKAGKGNPLLLAYIRFPVKQLYTSIKSLYTTRKLSTQSFECYRGGRISQTQLQYFRQNIKGFIQMQGFLSCSKSKKQMQQFIVNCIFRVTVNNLQRDSQCDHGFCILDDKQLTDYVKQQQVLFNIFCVMQIKSVYKQVISSSGKGEVDVIWLQYGSLASLLYQKKHNLILKDREYSQKCIDNYLALKPYYESIQSQVDCFRFFGKFNQVEMYYVTMIKYLEKHNNQQHDNNSDKYLHAYYSLGYNFLSQQNYSQAKSYLLQARDIAESSYHDQLLLSRIYNGLGIANKNLNKLIEAKQNYMKTIKLIEKKRNKQGKIYLATAYNNLALILVDQQQDGNALEYYKKALTLLDGRQNQTTANIHYNLGQYYLSKLHYTQSIKNLIKSLQLYTKLFGTHKQTINCHIKLGQAYLKSNSMQYNKHFTMAMDMMKNLVFHEQSDYIKMKREIEELKRNYQLKTRRAVSGVGGYSGEDVLSFLNHNKEQVRRYLSSEKVGNNNSKSGSDDGAQIGNNFPLLGRNFYSQHNSLSKFLPVNKQTAGNDDPNPTNPLNNNSSQLNPTSTQTNSATTPKNKLSSLANNQINISTVNSTNNPTIPNDSLATIMKNNSSSSTTTMLNNSKLTLENNKYTGINGNSNNFNYNYNLNNLNNNNSNNYNNNNSYINYNNNSTNITQQRDKLRQLRGKNLLEADIPIAYDSYINNNNNKSRYNNSINNDTNSSPPYMEKKKPYEPPAYQDAIDQKLAAFDQNDFINNLKLGRQKRHLIFG